MFCRCKKRAQYVVFLSKSPDRQIPVCGAHYREGRYHEQPDCMIVPIPPFTTH
jgi:hypothetical protein